MGFSWSKIGGALKAALPFVPVIGGPAGAVLKAVSTAVLVVEEVVIDQPSESKRQRAIDLTGTLLTIAEDAANRDLLHDQTLTEAVGAVVDAEVALRNAHAALEAVVEDAQAKSASD